MSVAAVGALLRASWYSARSYRLSLFIQIGGILVTVVPTYFIANALQQTMAGAIAGEAEQYFAFVLVGSVALMLVTTAMSSLPGAIGGGISSGYLEALLMTRAPLPSILAGLTAYPLLLVFIRCSVLMIAGSILGANVAWVMLLPALLILAVLVIAHWGIALIAASLVIAFRTSGPLIQVVTALTTLFGGVYYPVSAIPSWLGAIGAATPMAYGLRALRRVLLQGEAVGSVVTDVLVIAGAGAVLLTIGALSIKAALKYARKAGTLGTY
jgi:ABC-2 type transport system permease protein